MAPTRWRNWMLLLLALPLTLTACDGDDAAAVTDIGVTTEPCPAAVNPGNGCIFLGAISDLTEGPFRDLATDVTDAQRDFWDRVNADGGIGGYDVDLEQHIRDNRYLPEVHAEVFDEIRAGVVALAQSFGSPQTAAILQDLRDESIIAAPASSTSAWEFEDVIVESGTNYCMEMANAVDWFAEEHGEPGTVMAVHYPGDYGDDAAAGARMAAERIGAEFVDQPTSPGRDNQGPAIDAIVAQQPDLVTVTTGPAELATIVRGVATRGFGGTFIGSGPTWDVALLDTPAGVTMDTGYFQAAPWGPWGTDSPGHQAMRQAAGDRSPSEGYVAGWVWQYPIKAALGAAIEAGDVSRAGLLAAVQSLEIVDYEGMLPAEAGNYTDEPAEAVFRHSVVSQVDRSAPTGLAITRDFFTGPTAQAMEFTEPCF